MMGLWAAGLRVNIFAWFLNHFVTDFDLLFGLSSPRSVLLLGSQAQLSSLTNSLAFAMANVFAVL